MTTEAKAQYDKEYRKRWASKHPGYENNPQRKAYRITWQRTKYLTDPAFRAKMASNAQQWQRKLRSEILDAYGHQCTCCGESNEPFLTIDHVGGGGGAERKRVGAGTTFYRSLKKRGFPRNGYRTLCMNCNFATRWGRTCPHQLAVLKVV